MRKIVGALLLNWLLVILASIALLASDISGAVCQVNIQVTNSSYTATNVALPFTFNTQSLVNGGYVTSNLANTALRTTTGTDVVYMPARSGTDKWIMFIPQIGQNSSQNYILYTGGPAMNGLIRYFPDTGGMTTPYAANLELGNNFQIETSGYVDTSAGSNKYLIYKDNAFRTYVSAAGSITSDIATLYSGAFPTVAATNSGKDTVNTSHIINLPSGIASGNLLIIYLDSGSNPTITFPSGWTQLFLTANGTSNELGAWYRVADGTEGSTITVTTSTSQTTAHISYRITGYYGVPAVGTAATGSSVNPNPSSLTSGFGATNTLWLAVEGHFSTGSLSSYPTNYTGGINQYGGGSAASVSSAQRNLNAANEDPGVYTIGTSEPWVANTIAIGAAATYPIFVTATSVSSAEHIVKTTLAGGTLSLQIDSGAPVTTAFAGSVPNIPTTNWAFLQNGSMLYMSYHKITISGILRQHIIWQNSATFTDQSDNGNNATPTFRTTTNDADVVATLDNYSPIQQAKLAGTYEESPVNLVTEPPANIPEMYTEGSWDHIPGATLVNSLLDAAGIPESLFWFPAIYGGAAVFSLLIYGLSRSLLAMSVGGGIVLGFFALTGAVPFWTVIPFALIAIGTIIKQGTASW